MASESVSTNRRHEGVHYVIVGRRAVTISVVKERRIKEGRLATKKGEPIREKVSHICRVRGHVRRTPTSC